MSCKSFLAGILVIVGAAICLSPAHGEPFPWPCQGRCIDAAVIWGNSHAFFFKGSSFRRFDMARDKADLGEIHPYPRPLTIWQGFPRAWATGIDAALNGGNGDVYLFKGRESIRLDVAAAKVDDGPRPTATRFPGLPELWATKFDAAVNWGSGKALFFKGAEYLIYDLANDRADAPQPIANSFPGLPATWSAGIDTVVNWANGKAYFFKGHEYVRYDLALHKADPNYPRPIATNWVGLVPLVDWSMTIGDQFPEHALRAGRDANGRDLFVCTAVAGSAVYPGKTWSGAKSCFYSDGQRELSTNVFAVATTTMPIAWVPETAARLATMVPVGNSSHGRLYHLCRGAFANGIHPGRVEGLPGGCTINHEGRSHVLNDNFEVALAPTPVNPPVLPHLVKMLSPFENSERYKNECIAEVTLTVHDSAAAARYPTQLPDIKTTLQILARNVCSLLYKAPSEVPGYARRVEVVIENNAKNSSDAFVNRSETHCTLTINPRMFLDPGRNSPLNLITVLYHEVTHVVQQSKSTGRFVGAFNEGVADYIEYIKVWERRLVKTGGEWSDGYRSMAYFLEWLEQRHPGFVYRYNMSRASGAPWSVEVVQRLTGKPVEALWQEYQRSLAATLPLPESQLKWSREKKAAEVAPRAAATGTLAATRFINRLYTFGDSYSDGGNGYALTRTPKSPPYQSRYSNGMTAVEYLASALGFTLRFSEDTNLRSDDSVNFAVSGAWTSTKNNDVAMDGRTGLLSQVAQFEQRTKDGQLRFDPESTLFFLGVGTNDVLFGNILGQENRTLVPSALQNLEQAVRSLHAAGARHIAIATIPAIEKTPRGGTLQARVAGLVGEAVRAINDGYRELAGRMRTELKADVFSVPWGEHYDDLMANPSAYGLSAGACMHDRNICPDPDRFVFFDPLHPTTAAHKVVGHRLATENAAHIVCPDNLRPGMKREHPACRFVASATGGENSPAETTNPPIPVEPACTRVTFRQTADMCNNCTMPPWNGEVAKIAGDGWLLSYVDGRKRSGSAQWRLQSHSKSELVFRDDSRKLETRFDLNALKSFQRRDNTGWSAIGDVLSTDCR